MSSPHLNKLIDRIKRVELLDTDFRRIRALDGNDAFIINKIVRKTNKQLLKESDIIISYVENRTLSWTQGEYVYDKITGKIGTLNIIQRILNGKRLKD